MPKDWKETLFVWDGILSFVEPEDDISAEKDAAASNIEGDSIKWEGTWIGFDFADATKVDTPKRGAFDRDVSSVNKFEVRGQAVKGGKEEAKAGEDPQIIGGKLSSLYRASMIGGPGYDLDGKKRTDTVHDVYFSTLRW
jgi:hypothetical protein